MNSRRPLPVARLGIALLVASMSGLSARADEITYDFSGTISYVSQTGTTPAGGPYSVTTGQAFTGTFSFDPSTPASYTGTNLNQFSDPSATLSITVGSTTFGESFFATYAPPVNTLNVFYDNDNGSGYSNAFQTYLNGTTTVGSTQETASGEVNLANFTPTPLGYLPSSGLPTSLSLAELPDSSFTLYEFLYNESTSTSISRFELDGSITNLSLVPQSVPEPSSMVMMGLAIGLAGVRCWARR